jgi:hypothetical protein
MDLTRAELLGMLMVNKGAEWLEILTAVMKDSLAWHLERMRDGSELNWVVEKVSLREKPKTVAMAMWMDLIEVG